MCCHSLNILSLRGLAQLQQVSDLLLCTLQILTHIKEKLQFVEKENSSLALDLGGIESQLAARREELQVTKTQRDKLRDQGRKIKDRSVFVTQNVLLQDMEVGSLSRWCRLQGRVPLQMCAPIHAWC
jgi:predicted nuclease with TOPRIM domain